MLAHELEHVIEQIDGTKLHELAGKQRSGVTRFADGAFETVRAERAGRAAIREVEGTTGTAGSEERYDSAVERGQCRILELQPILYPSYLSYRRTLVLSVRVPYVASARSIGNACPLHARTDVHG